MSEQPIQDQVAETAAQVAQQAQANAEQAQANAETAQKLAEAAGASPADDAPEAEAPTPEAVLRRSRQAVDEGLSSVASVDVEMEAAGRRVSELEADLERARDSQTSTVESRRQLVQDLRDACDASIAAIEAVKAAHPLPQAQA